MQLKGRSLPRLDKKLAGYTLIGAAAFTVTGIAHADDITYVPNVNVHVDGTDATPSYTLNLGPTSITLSASATSDVFEGGVDSVSAGSGAFILTDSNGAEALGGNTIIDATSSGWGAGGTMTNTYKGKEFPRKTVGDWPNSGGSGYLGFYFQDTDGTHTGWAEITTWSTPTDASFTLDRYAYDNTPNSSIATAPEPSTLSLLATGAAGLLELRRRRRANA